MKCKQEFKKIQARRVTSIKFGEIIQKVCRNAKIANIDKFEVLKTATDAKVSQANKRNPDDNVLFQDNEGVFVENPTPANNKLSQYIHPLKKSTILA